MRLRALPAVGGEGFWLFKRGETEFFGKCDISHSNAVFWLLGKFSKRLHDFFYLKNAVIFNNQIYLVLCIMSKL